MSLLRDVATGFSTAATMGTPWGWAIGGAGALSSIFSAVSKDKQYDAESESLRKKRTSAQSALTGLDEVERQQIDIAEDQFGLGLDKAKFQVGQSLYGITRTGTTAAASTGFAFSGDVQKQIEKGTQAGVASFGFTTAGLQDMLGQKLLNIGEDIGGKLSLIHI